MKGFWLMIPAYRRIARVVKGLKSPPVHLPRQWSEYHYKNFLAFFALPKGNSSHKWVAEIDGDKNGVKFDKLMMATGPDFDLTKHVPPLACWAYRLFEFIA